MAIGSVSGFYMGGRPSGLPEDYEDQLVEIKRQQKLQPLQEEIQELQSESATFSTLQTKLGSMVSASANLSETSAFDVYSVSVDDTDVLTASTTSEAEAGSYSIDVSQVAQAHNQTVQAQAHRIGYDDGGTLTGISDAGDASLMSDSATLSFEHNGSKSIALDADTTLNSLAEDINSQDWNVRALVNNIGTSDSPEYVLELQSQDTGTSITSISGEIFDGQTMQQAQVEAGISDFEDASLISDGVELSFYHEGTSYSYQTDSETTLASLAIEINSEENGVQASLTNTGTEDKPNYIMTLKSRSTGGGDNRITTDSNGNNVGVSVSGGDLFAGGQAQEEVQSGQNALFTIDGVSYERSSNQVDDAISGVNLNLNQTGSSVNLNVSRNDSAIAQKVQSFVSAFNEAQSYIDSETNYSAESDSGGALLNSSLARRASRKMSNVIMEPISGTSNNAYSYLSDIGIQLNDDGTLELDSEQFSSALESNPDDVQALFTGDDGVANKMNEAVTSYTDSTDGAITYKLDSIDRQVDELNEETEEVEQYLLDYQERLIDKYTHMESVIRQYQSIQDQLEGYIDQWTSEA